MNDKQIRQVTGEDNEGVRWIAQIGASIAREDNKGRGKAIKDIRHNEDNKYEVLFYGGEHLILTVHDDDVLTR
jgi:hypothetical protein